jgi:hypothetical protein
MASLAQSHAVHGRLAPSRARLSKTVSFPLLALYSAIAKTCCGFEVGAVESRGSGWVIWCAPAEPWLRCASAVDRRACV